MVDSIDMIQCELLSNDPEARISAVRQLAQLPAPPMEGFAQALSDAAWRVRKAAVESFFSFAHPAEHVAELIGFLHHEENAGLRNSSIEILIKLGQLAVAQLEQEIDGEDVEVRKFVIDILGEIGDSHCGEKLVKSLTDTDINVRYAAAETLGKLQFVAAVDPLLELLADPDPGLKFTIFQSLAQIGQAVPVSRLTPYLDDGLLRKSLFDCLARVGNSEALPFLVEGLCDPMRLVREAALNALYELKAFENVSLTKALDKANNLMIVAELERVLVTGSAQLKAAALTLYPLVGRVGNLRVLLVCLDDESLRCQALAAFRTLGEDAFSRLVTSIQTPDSNEVMSLVFVAGELGFQAGLSLALEGGRANDPQLRYVSALTLGKLGRETELQLLLGLLDDELSEVQDAATDGLCALGQRQPELVFPAVAPLLEASEVQKRVRVVKVLGSLADNAVEKQLFKAFKDSSSLVRCEALRAFVGRSEGVISGVTLALTDESADVRRLAVGVLGQFPPQQYLAALSLAAKDSDIWVRSAVMRALETGTGEEVLGLLQTGFEDPVGVVAIAALESLMQVTPDQAVKFLETALRHADEEVVKTAMNQLLQLKGPEGLNAHFATLLDHGHWDVRLHAVKALGQSAAESVSALLEKRLTKEEEPLVLQEIKSVLSYRFLLKRQDP